MPNTAPQTPTACARSRGSVKVLVMIDIATGFIIEAAHRLQHAERHEQPDARREAAQQRRRARTRVSPMTNVRLRPNRSAVEPESMSRLAITTV